jgi:hypothetical protein
MAHVGVLSKKLVCWWFMKRAHSVLQCVLLTSCLLLASHTLLMLLLHVHASFCCPLPPGVCTLQWSAAAARFIAAAAASARSRTGQTRAGGSSNSRTK